MTTFLMAKPEYFRIQYIINPWMKNQVGKVNKLLALQQWEALYGLVSQYADVKLVDPVDGVPDLVFTANAASIKGKHAILSHFHYPERQLEEPIYKRWLLDNDFEVIELPEDVYFEGAGDALFQPDYNTWWMGYGFRSQQVAADYLSEYFQAGVKALKLIDGHFYHLDTCFCPLADGYVMYYPGAFDKASLEAINSIVPKSKQIVVNKEDADTFSCNAVAIDKPKTGSDKVIIMNAASDALKKKLNNIGYEVITTSTNEYIRAGGATKCMTLELD